MNVQLAEAEPQGKGANGGAQKVGRFSGWQMGALGALLFALLGVWAAGTYWVLSETGFLGATVVPGAAESPPDGSDAVAKETRPAAATPAPLPTATFTPLALPSIVTVPGRIDPELGWGIFQGYLERLRLEDIQGASVLAHNPLEWELCIELGLEESCQEMLNLAYEEGAAVERKDLVDLWGDENQLIMGANPIATPEGEGEASPVRYSRLALIFLRNAQGEIKFLMLQSTSWVEDPSAAGESQASSHLIDSDQDGLSDYEENCTHNDPPCEQPTDALQRDSDGDGYWDGIEVAADSDPNNAASLP